MVRYTICFLLLSTVTFWSCNNAQKQQKETPEVTQTVEEPTKENDAPVILFFGNSITAGYQLEVKEAFPALIQDRLDSLGYNYRVINAGLSGETTAAGLNRIEWVLQTIPEIFVLELGANDGLRGLDLDKTKKNLAGIIAKVREANPDVKVILAGMEVPPNLGNDYTTKFRNLFKELASEEHTELIPFLLNNVAGISELNLNDGIHPTPEGHQIVADNVWPILKPLLDKEPTS
ncbi:arylesterase [Marinoscillum pacificum]|uniref:arylesterase n=1 Tax=Marinoscillum pacificum TaxID=392723 RepID=UPI002157A302|nr:arylesterase [Marinoscillum pacificum]